MKLFVKLVVALVLPLALAAPSAPCAAAPVFSARVTKVADGDSLEVEYGGEKIKLRLWGIDAPETRQAYGRQARALLAAMVKGRQIQGQGMDVDSYNRLVALVFVDGQSVNEEMVRQGAAWVYDRYCREAVCHSWRRLQDEARRAGRGLWANGRATPPWRERRATQPGFAKP